ncbi:hypothetical protein HYH02_012018 [Chlamydomonas schloesseri]|uniref:Uncharacterized protein n=1 Tax=Chlamydomonas schloesseri TaxID=2026947 RepID=A0A835TBB2_9CHLO|nr:hypothetical protein HYH02_012018 [Chlamydomonas schloesseri]|eukprot:KAG2435021.1 hypothetical protein HYH02_012018 [Chlamydomonas schloesseri]
MAARLLRDPEADGWERSDMPIVCETCLGPNPFVRMQRIEYGGTCHISGRPYTVFRWRPGNDARYKKTVICQEVAKAKNVCQVCLLDLEYGLPVQVRDAAMGVKPEDEPQSEVGKEYKLQMEAEAGTLGGGGVGGASSSYAAGRPNEMLQKLQRSQPYYKRNQARVCSFFAKGQCTRGAECPYRHELPTADPALANQSYKDRYYGTNDPVAAKMLKRVDELNKLTPPEDTSITTLYVGGLDASTTEDDVRDAFYSFGELASVRKMDVKSCAFVTYTTRSAAEKAAEELGGNPLIKGARVKLMWGRPPPARNAAAAADPMQPSSTTAGGAPAPGSAASYYPSMDPSAMGSRAPGGPPGMRPGEGGGGGGGMAPPRPMGYGAPPPGYGAPPPGYGAPPRPMVPASQAPPPQH